VRGGTFVSIPFGGRRLWLGMESRFYVEAKSFLFSVGQGSLELKVAEKQKAFAMVVLLGSRCTVWLLLMVEEVLRNLGVDDFVKSFREGSKVTIMWRGGNRFGRFLEVAIYAVGLRRGLVLFPKGHDGRGWSRVLGELSKVLAFLEDVGKMGKVAGSMPFPEVVCTMAPVSVKGFGKKGVGAYYVSEMETQQAVAWGVLEENFSMVLDCSTVFWQPVDCFTLEKHSFCTLGNTLRVSVGSRCSSTSCKCEVEKILSLGLEQVTAWQAVDCFALERTPFGPLGKDRRVDGSRVRSCRGC